MAHNVEVLITGPLTRVGMNEAGTLQEVRAFMELVRDVRRQYGRPLAVVIVHHESKSGAVSGAWEGSGDTLLHVESAGNGHTIVHVQKARWDPERHGTTLKLAWAAGEGFEVEGERDRLAEVTALLADGVRRTAKEIAAPSERGGIGANVDEVKELLEGHPDLFASRTGDAAKALGRHPSAVVWELTQAPESAESATDSQGGGAGQVTPDSPLKGVRSSTTPPLPAPEVTQTSESPPPDRRPYIAVAGTAEADLLAQADRIRQTVLSRECHCAVGPDELDELGRCSRCYGWPPNRAVAGGGDSSAMSQTQTDRGRRGTAK